MSAPRIILLDLETVPDLNQALRLWPSLSNYPGATIRANASSIICVGWKEFGSAHEAHCLNAWDFPEWLEDVNNDKKLCEFALDLLTGADAVVTHNGKRFDWKFLQTRLRYHGLPPLPPIAHIDTCSESRGELLMVNNRLMTVADFFTDQQKLDHDGWPLWVRVHGGFPRERNEEAEQLMSDYCKQDIITLEAVYRAILPLLKSVPNHNLFSPFKEKVCPKCGSTRLRPEGHRYTKTGRTKRYSCEDCGAWSSTNMKDEIPR